MYIEFANQEEICIDDLSQDQVNQILKDSFEAGFELSYTDIPDHLWSADGERIQYWDDFKLLSRDFEGKFSNDALFAGIQHDGSLDRFEEYYLGQFSSNADYAQDYIESIYSIPDFISFHVDWDAIYSQLDVTEIDGYYFRLS